MNPKRLLNQSLMALLVTLTIARSVPAQQTSGADILIADFESETYGNWKVEGDAFGEGPAEGTLPGQMHVSGFVGKRLVNSFRGGDGPTGTLTSPPFRIERPWLNFLIGGGGYSGETCVNLLIDGKVVRTETGPNAEAGGSEELQPASWDVNDLMGQTAIIQIIDKRSGGWGHINVDQISLSDKRSAPIRVALKTTLRVASTHLIVPVSNSSKPMLLGIYSDNKLRQSFSVGLPQTDEPYWLAAYPLASFAAKGSEISIAPVDGSRLSESYVAAFDQIKVGRADEAFDASDYEQPYRNQFHASTRRGWNNDPNGMVFHNGKYHLYYQHNPFGVHWGNMHWGHLESTDLIHWEEKPLALFQKTVSDMAFSGGGFVDVNDSAGLGKGTLFAAFTSTGRGECLAFSKDGGLTFSELPENPVVKHPGRDPKIIWYQPEQKWVMVLYDESPCPETDATPAHDKALTNRNLAFYESKNLRQWNRTGAFTDPDRGAVFECPEMFELPVSGESDQSRWILLGAQNRYFVGTFDGKTFRKESGPHGTQHGAFYAAQTFSDVADGRRIQVGWVQTSLYLDKFPAQVVNQAFTLSHELTLRETKDGLRVFFTPVAEAETLRSDVLAEGKNLTVAEVNQMLQKCKGELSEVLIEFSEPAPIKLVINGIDASFNGRTARVLTDRTFNEIYADDGGSYELRNRSPQQFDSTESKLTAEGNVMVQSLRIYRLKSIWPAK